MSDTFDNILPLPYRVISLITLGSWLWLLTLKISQKVGINIISLLKFDDLPSTNLDNLEFYKNHEKNCVNLSLIGVVSYLVFQVFHNQDQELLTIWDFLPLITLVLILYLLVNPNNHGSKRLFSTFKRILKGQISQQIRTNDILLSDTLTSYSKILIDLSIYLCHLINNETCLPKKSGSKLNRHCGESILLDSIIGLLPTLIRLNQCWNEYKLSNFKNKTHILNFMKYLTNVPILIITLYMKIQQVDLTTIWIIAAILNSSYTFIWDVNNDWNLNLFKKFINGSNNDSILRFKLHYNFKFFYYLAIFSDFIFRFIWIWKFLAPATDSDTLFYIWISSLFSSEFGLYSLQIIEIIRRWIWVFIKIEVDYINLNPLDQTSKDSIELNAIRS